MNFTPPYPKPHKNKSSFFLRFLRGWNSWLDVLFERSYSMKMGQIRQPGMDVYMVNDTDWVRNILADTRKYPKHHLMHRMLEPLLGISIFTTNGRTWERQRALVDQAFVQARLKLVFGLMADAVTDMLARMDQVADGRSKEVDGEMTYVTADIIFRTILSETLGEKSAREIYDAFVEFQHHAQRAMILMIYRIPPYFATRASRRSAQKIRAFLSTIITGRVKEAEGPNPPVYNDILAGLMEAKDRVSHDSFNYEELVDQVCMLFLAGHETSASALTWALYLISHAPDMQQRMVEEIEREVGTRPFEIGDIKSLPTVGDVFREALRLYPPVGFFVREATHDHCIRDKNVKEGSPILIAPWLLHRHRALWDKPDEFDPDRFNTAEGKESAKCAYIPFSKGPRVCIGAAYATQEAVLILASIARRYRIEPDPDHVPRPVGRVTIRSDNGVRVRMVPRERHQ
jgi:cytochrome P450